MHEPIKECAEERMENRGFRNELKFLLNSADARFLERRLTRVLSPDPHANPDGTYDISSLYFDDAENNAYFDKIGGVSEREKYRIRTYNGSGSFISLEKKEKRSDLVRKTGQVISAADAEALLSRTFPQNPTGLMGEVISLEKSTNLSPKLFVDYRRKTYLHPCGTLRLTFDSAIRAIPYRNSLFSDGGGIPVLEPGTEVLEVKFTGVLLPQIRALLSDIPMCRLAISKFCMCCEVLY